MSREASKIPSKEAQDRHPGDSARVVERITCILSFPHGIHEEVRQKQRQVIVARELEVTAMLRFDEVLPTLERGRHGALLVGRLTVGVEVVLQLKVAQNVRLAEQ